MQPSRRFPPEFVEKLRHAVRLSDIVGKRVKLQRRGKEFVACCPFHAEKTPSFTLNDVKGFYHCFGCGAHGDAIGFYKDYERLEYAEAVEKLAAEAGIPLPRLTENQARALDRHERLMGLMEQACRWFEHQLRAPNGEVARRYVASRGLTEATVTTFRIGYAPPASEGLRQAMQKLGYSEQELIDVGLTIRPEKASAGGEVRLYDRFRERLMFPICNLSGKVIAFGGRILPHVTGEGIAKYHNSPETVLFHKKEVLYGAHLARKAAYDSGTVWVVEGYMDVVMLHQCGVPHAVAPLGTAMGESHLRQLWQWVEEPMFCLDGDAAGQRAMQRLAELALPLVKPGQGIRFASLPAKDDPDSFIQREGKTAWERLAEQSVTLSEALLKQASEGVRWGIPEEAAATEQKLMQLASRVADAMLQQHYKNFFRNAVWQAMREAGRNKERVADAAAIQHTGTGNSPSRRSLSRSQREQPFAGGLVSPDEVKAALRRATPQMLQCQRELLSLLAHYPELLCDSEIEEECLRWELAEETLDKLRNVLLRLSVSMGESPDREAWQKALCEQGGKTLLECSLPRKDLAPPLQWQLALKRMHLEQLKEEQNYATFLLQDYEDQHLWSERIRAIQEEILKINQEIEMLLGSYY